MPNAARAFLVDTNVLVYAYDPADATKRVRAMTIVDQLASWQRGALSAQVLSEFFVTVTRKIEPPLTLAEAERSVTNYMRSWLVYESTARVVVEAIRGVRQHQLSYWDSLIWATAKLAGVPTVLSEDFTDGQLLEGVRFRNPFGVTFAMTLLDLA
jgi:predicted nucleic acid-binding protein